MIKLLDSYVKWVRNNEENAMSLERLTRTMSFLTMDPRNLVSREFAHTLVELHSFSNSMILATAGRRVRFSERVAIIAKAIREVECLFELLLRRYFDHISAWNGLLVLQLFKCLLDLLVHRQLFLVPWIWAAVRRAIRGFTQSLLRPRASRLESTASPQPRDAENCPDSVCLGPANARLVIPRVAAPRMPHCTACEAESEALPCTLLDLLGVAVDLVMLLRPLLILYYARRVFPVGAKDVAVIPRPPKASDAAEAGNGLFLVHAVLRDGVTRSLLSNWGVWLSFAGMDAVLLGVSRYIRRHRVPVVYINERSETQRADAPHAETGTHVNGHPAPSPAEGVRGNGSVATIGGEVPSRGAHAGEESGVEETNTTPLPPLPRPPSVGNAAGQTPMVSRDSLRVQQAMRNVLFSVLRDPFFPAVLQKAVYDKLVAGRINRIPLLGPLLGYQVSYFLCKQHYSFMYSLGQ